MATEEDDPLPDDSGGFDRWRTRFRVRLRRDPGPVARAGSPGRRGHRRGGLRRLPASPGGVRHRGHHVGARLSAGPGRRGWRRGRRCWPCTATDRASRGCAGSSPRRSARGATTPPSWPDRATWSWPRTCAASASGPTGTQPTTTAVTPTWSIRSWAGGTRSPRTCGIWPGALDVLEAHPLVDPARMGMVGFSYGGTVTLFLAALDPRVAAAVVSGYFSSWAEAHKVPWNMCGSQVLFGMLGRMEHADRGCPGRSPAARSSSAGRDDPLFPVAAAEAVGRLRVQRVWDRAGAGDRLALDVFDGEHQWYGARAYAFLERWLRARPGRTRRPRPGDPGRRRGSAPAGRRGQEAGRVAVEEEGGVGRAAGGSRPDTTGPPVPSGRAAHRCRLAGLGDHGQDRRARSRAGMVTVIAMAPARRHPRRK